ncbi:MAG: 1-(5-phosphoribosyl)-5-[(5-phosphoribosylamino)methylideneamino] imidazole-4-carboxamide isomerase [Chloroflexota bacterium]
MIVRKHGDTAHDGFGDRAFQLLPAIDIRGGQVVRLERGDFARETVFATDPVAAARLFVDGGATGLHLVDLDGARDGSRANAAAISAVIQSVGPGVAVEVAGGLRSTDGVAAVLAEGAVRAVIGTRALVDPAFVETLIRDHGPDKVAVSIDVRDGLAVGQGWVSGAAGVPVGKALASLLAVGVVWFEVTAIARDGVLGGPDLELLAMTMENPAARVIAAGGIATTQHLKAVRAVGCRGAIVGRALYDGTMPLTEAINATT